MKPIYRLIAFEFGRHIKDRNTVILLIVVFILLNFSVIALFSVPLSTQTFRDIVDSSVIFSKCTSVHDLYYHLFNSVLPFFLLVFYTVIPTQIGIPSIVGDKESGFLETLLFLPIRKKDVFLIKNVSVILVSYMFMVLTSVSILVIISLLASTSLIYWKTWLLFICFTLPAYVMFLSTFVSLISAKTKTSKEAQQYALGLAFVLLLSVQVMTMTKMNIFSIEGLSGIGACGVILSVTGIMYLYRRVPVEGIVYGIKL
jgi:hypothetical protein